tara:strand:+ start:108 stop:224 length:117 start_codon:yes stop_codon:yes gene_type:complete
MAQKDKKNLDHDCGDPDCEGLHGGMADIISAPAEGEMN